MKLRLRPRAALVGDFHPDMAPFQPDDDRATDRFFVGGHAHSQGAAPLALGATEGGLR